jgi:hypothetical protein
MGNAPGKRRVGGNSKTKKWHKQGVRKKFEARHIDQVWEVRGRMRPAPHAAPRPRPRSPPRPMHQQPAAAWQLGILPATRCPLDCARAAVAGQPVAPRPHSLAHRLETQPPPGRTCASRRRWCTHPRRGPRAPPACERAAQGPRAAGTVAAAHRRLRQRQRCGGALRDLRSPSRPPMIAGAAGLPLPPRPATTQSKQTPLLCFFA